MCVCEECDVLQLGSPHTHITHQTAAVASEASGRRYFLQLPGVKLGRPPLQPVLRWTRREEDAPGTGRFSAAEARSHRTRWGPEDES